MHPSGSRHFKIAFSTSPCPTDMFRQVDGFFFRLTSVVADLRRAPCNIPRSTMTLGASSAHHLVLLSDVRPNFSHLNSFPTVV
jgi:hypothetical protein